MGMAVGGDSLPDYSDYRGVYIEDVDGYLYTEDEWDGSKTANGIAVLTDNCRFVIALQDASDTECQWGSYGTLVGGITTTESEDEAATDYDGEVQTTAILSELGNSSSTSDAPAAYYCRAFTFPNGKKGYLGAAGEWQAANDVYASVDSAMRKCGGEDILYGYWTSTQRHKTSSWSVQWFGCFIISGFKNYVRSVRAFAALKSDERNEEGENPYAFSFNIEVAKGSSWTANTEQLVQINKMFAIVTNFLGIEGGEFNQDNAPQEFDLRINGVRNFNFSYGSVRNENDVVDFYYAFNDGDGLWFGNKSFPWNNPVVGSFTIYST